MNAKPTIDVDQLKLEIEAVIARLRHARTIISRDEDLHIEEICAQIERCAEQIAALSKSDCLGIQTLLVAMHDEVDRTMAAFNDILKQGRRQLTATSQSRAAGAAYRQLGKF